MFANLKKKIEEEVGDLSRLSSPINLVGALGDRRVGGSTQGTNTPSLGSRQSSVASLVDIGPGDNSRVPQNRPHYGSGHPNANLSSKDMVAAATNEELQHLKKANADLKSKLDNLKKTYEEKLQSQEADFAWKYATKDDELIQLRNEKERFKEQIKGVETSWQEKYVRVATELENLEGLSKQENAKVKHLLLNTQNDLQSALIKVAQLESEAKNRKDRDNVNIWLATEGFNNGNQQLPPTSSNNNSSEHGSSGPVSQQTAEEDKSGELLDKIRLLEEQNQSLNDKLTSLESSSFQVSRKYEALLVEQQKKQDELESLGEQLRSLNLNLTESQLSRQRQEEQHAVNIRSSQSEIDNLKKQLEKSSKEIDVVSKELSKLTRLKDINESDLISLRSENVTLTSNLENAEEAKEKLERKYENKIQSDRAELDSLKNRLEKSSKEITTKQDEISSLTSLNDMNENELITLRNENSTLKTNLEIAETWRKEEERQKIKEVANLNAIENQEQESPEQIKIDSLIRDVEALSQKFNQSQELIQSLTKEKNDLNASMERRVREHQQELESLNNRYKIVEQDHNSETTKIKHRIEELEEQLHTFQNKNHSLQEQVDELPRLRSAHDELVQFRNEVIQFKNLTSAVIKPGSPEENNIISNNNNSIEDFTRLMQFIVHKLKVYHKLEEEMKVIKDEASREVGNLQCKTEELIAASIRDLKETQKKLDEQTMIANELRSEMEQAKHTIVSLEQELKKSKEISDHQKAAIEKLSNQIEEEGKRYRELTAIKEEQTQQLQNLQRILQREQATLSELRPELELAAAEISSLEQKLVQSRQALDDQKSATDQAESAAVLSLKKSLQDQKTSFESKLDEVRKENQILHAEIKSQKKTYDQREQELQTVLVQLDEANTRKIQNDEEVRLLEEKNRLTANELQEVKSAVLNLQSENNRLSTEVKEASDLLDRQKQESNDSVADIQVELISLRESLSKQECLTNEEVNKQTQLRRDLDEAQAQLRETKDQIMKLQDEKDLIDSQLDELSVHKALAEEEAKTAVDRNAELYSEVTELKKSLKTNRQQLSELKKSLHKELKNDLNNSSVSSHAPTSATSLGSVSHMEEVSLRDVHQGDSPLSEVNFMYLRSVLFKYLTASDPQVAANLVRVVATLLELKPEEEKMLKETQESHSRWFNSFMKK